MMPVDEKKKLRKQGNKRVTTSINPTLLSTQGYNNFNILEHFYQRKCFTNPSFRKSINKILFWLLWFHNLPLSIYKFLGSLDPIKKINISMFSQLGNLQI